MREVTSGRGSKFVLCRKSQEDDRFAKYPPQPIVKCAGYCERAVDDAERPRGQA
jgi:hypothetical protein